MTTQERLERLEWMLRTPDFGRNIGSNSNYWIFDYPPEDELQVRNKIKELHRLSRKSDGTFHIKEFDLYDMVIDYLEDSHKLERTARFEEQKGLDYICSAISRSIRLDTDECFLITRIKESADSNDIVLITGLGKIYPIVRGHKILNLLKDNFKAAPVVLFLPGTYDEREILLFGNIKDNNHYRARRIVQG